MLMRNGLLLTLVFASVMLVEVHAYFNVTYLNTTVILGANGTAHVVEQLSIFVSNSSISSYSQDRAAINLTLSDWQKALGTTVLVQHIINPRSSVYGFTLLPGALKSINQLGGQATITMDYYAKNVTTVVNVAPRKFKYTLNDSVFNFEPTASGQQLFSDTRLNIEIPSGSHVNTIFPLPDQPAQSGINGYKNDTYFSWYASEPLAQFSFSYTVTESLQQEVVSYFTGLYTGYRLPIYFLVALVIALFMIYVYVKVIVEK